MPSLLDLTRILSDIITIIIILYVYRSVTDKGPLPVVLYFTPAPHFFPSCTFASTSPWPPSASPTQTNEQVQTQLNLLSLPSLLFFPLGEKGEEMHIHTHPDTTAGRNINQKATGGGDPTNNNNNNVLPALLLVKRTKPRR